MRQSSQRYLPNSRLAGLLSPLLVSAIAPAAVALPPATDPPEEVLRTHVITAARSPINGKAMTAAEYAELEAQLQTPPPNPPQVSRKLQKTVNLLRVRKVIKTIFPFIPLR